MSIFSVSPHPTVGDNLVLTLASFPLIQELDILALCVLKIGVALPRQRGNKTLSDFLRVDQAL